jgi:hypothetical protein
MKSMKFTIVDDGTEDTVVTVRVIDDGIDLEFMAEPREEGRRCCHVWTAPLGQGFRFSFGSRQGSVMCPAC